MSRVFPANNIEAVSVSDTPSDVTLGEVYRLAKDGFQGVHEQIAAIQLQLRNDYVPRTELNEWRRVGQQQVEEVCRDVAAIREDRRGSMWTFFQWVTVVGVVGSLVLAVIALAG